LNYLDFIEGCFDDSCFNQPYIIAEIGVNHGGSIDLAKKQISLAASAGADAVKFQSYKASSIVVSDAPAYWDLSEEPCTTQHALFSKYDGLDPEDYEILKEWSSKEGVDFMSTPFDELAVEYLDALVPAFKISSSDMTNKPLIDLVCSKGKPIILSTGASYIEEVDQALDWIKAYQLPVCLMHCVLSYPTTDGDANLAVIKGLKERYPNIVIGYSDHTKAKPGALSLTTAWLLGARIIEKHFTHDKKLKGNDHYHAMDAKDLSEFRLEVSKLINLLGSSERTVFSCEKESRIQARRSLVSKMNIAKGDFISPGMITWKRPAVGIEPKFIEELIGKVASVDIPEDTSLRWDMFDE